MAASFISIVVMTWRTIGPSSTNNNSALSLVDQIENIGGRGEPLDASGQIPFFTRLRKRAQQADDKRIKVGLFLSRRFLVFVFRRWRGLDAVLPLEPNRPVRVKRNFMVIDGLN